MNQTNKQKNKQGEKILILIDDLYVEIPATTGLHQNFGAACGVDGENISGNIWKQTR